MSVMITSKKNELIRQSVRLAESAAFRREQRLFFLEGARLCSDAVRSGVPVAAALYTPQAGEKYASYLGPVLSSAEKAFAVSPEVASALSDTKTPLGVFCLCRLPEKGEDPFSLLKDRHYLAFENLQDPANLGSVLRTAEALGIGGVLLSSGCCDVYSPKVLRASMGAVFRLPLYSALDMPKTVADLGKAGFLTLAAVPDRAARPVTELCFDRPSVMVIGNEGNGLTPETQEACSLRVTVPMAGRAESLNASVSAAILAWEMMRAVSGGKLS